MLKIAQDSTGFIRQDSTGLVRIVQDRTRLLRKAQDCSGWYRIVQNSTGMYLIDRCSDLSPVLTLLAVLFKVVADGLSTGVGP